MVVVGGGSVGTAVLYHLARLGVDALLLERAELTSGTTWHSAGLMWQLAGLLGAGDVDLELSQYTKELVTDTLPAETGDWAGWQTTGSLFACQSDRRLAAHNRTRSLAGALYGVESRPISAAEAKRIHPLLNVTDLVGCVHTPSDGHIDPNALVAAYAKAAKQRGARVHEGVAVDAALTAPGAGGR